MRWVLSAVIVLLLSSLFAEKADAALFIPVIVLIPIAKVVAVIIGGFSFTAIGVGAIWSKFFGKSLGRTILVILATLLTLSIILAIFFKLLNPDRPLF